MVEFWRRARNSGHFGGRRGNAGCLGEGMGAPGVLAAVQLARGLRDLAGEERQRGGTAFFSSDNVKYLASEL